MKRLLLLPLLAAIALPTAVDSSIRIEPINKGGYWTGRANVTFKNDNKQTVRVKYPVNPYCSEAKAYMISVLAGNPKRGGTGFFGRNEDMSISQVNQLLRSLENSIPLEYQDRQKVFSIYADTFYEQFKIVKYPSKPFDCGPGSSRSERFPDWNY